MEPRKRKRNISSISPVPARRIPQRTCVGCRKIKAKSELVRLVRTPGGGVIIDTGKKADGRGAYLCPDWKCWEKALKSKQLERVLKNPISRDDYDKITERGKELLKESSG